MDDSLQAIFDQGHDVGDWAKKVFPDGIDNEWEAGFEEVICQSADMLGKQGTVLCFLRLSPLNSYADLISSSSTNIKI